MVKRAFLIVAALAILAASTPLRAAVQYQEHYLAYSNPAYAYGYATAINNNLQCVGNSDLGATLWQSVAASPTALKFSGADPFDINDCGFIVGHNTALNNDGSAWPDPNTVVRCVPGASHVNESGVVVGVDHYASKWTTAGTTTLGSGGGTPYAINDSGLIAGVGMIGSYLRVVEWNTDGTYSDTGALTGSVSGLKVIDINNAGQILGAFGSTAFLWTPGVGRVDLPFHDVHALNDLGQVVGSASSGGFKDACVWSQQGGLVDLGRGDAYDVNDLGWIAGEKDSVGQSRAIVWQPVPEPSAVLCLLSFSGGLACLVRRRTSR